MSYVSYPLQSIPAFSGIFFGKIILSGICFGICALLLIESLHNGERLAQAIPLRTPLKGILGGVALIGLANLFSQQYLGLGIETIETCLQGQPAFPAAFLLKMLFVSITLNFCGSGGIITPIFFVGSTVGNLYGQILGGDLPFFSAIGMVSLLAGAANTPLAAMIMATELFGVQIAPYAAIACITSFLMAGHRTVYPSQILLVSKSTSLGIETQKELRDIHDVHITAQHMSLIGMIMNLFRNRNSQ
jgi:H+/Cl- antiporter ClcA